MSVRGVGGRGKPGGARGAGGAGRAGGASGPAKTSATAGAFGSRVDRAESLVGPSGAAGSGNVGGLTAADPVTAKAVEIIRQLQAGQIKSRDEATKKLVADILREKVRTRSKHLTEKIADQLKDDPRLNQTLDRLWKRAEEKE